MTTMTIEIPSKPKILVVDDERLIRTLATRFLESRYNVRTAENPAEALTMYISERPNKVLTDINMPGMTGLNLAEIIHAEDPTAMIYVMCGAFHGDQEKQLNYLMGKGIVKGYIGKPFELQNLYETLDGKVDTAPFPVPVPPQSL
ncbi:MAG TPA: response regulator [Candidatus Nanoarchaeia archaeon]|nr:response regulator [Candidatus Nanoarchaeia archaeon]